MKNFSLLIAVIYYASLNAQNLPESFFDTWYPIEIMASDGYPGSMFTDEVDPAIAPFLIIHENLEISGMGSCNTFTGRLEWDAEHDYRYLRDFAVTEAICESQSQIDFENNYFSFLQNSHWNPEITQENNGFSMSMSTWFFGYGYFNNYRMSTQEDNSLVKLELFPNPVSTILYIQSTENIQKTEIINSHGEIILQQSMNLNEVNIEQLNSGVYILKIYTDKGIQTEKFIKK